MDVSIFLCYLFHHIVALFHIIFFLDIYYYTDFQCVELCVWFWHHYETILFRLNN